MSEINGEIQTKLQPVTKAQKMLRRDDNTCCVQHNLATDGQR